MFLIKSKSIYLEKNIPVQFRHICRETLEITKDEFRAVNRFVKNNVVFNLLTP